MCHSLKAHHLTSIWSHVFVYIELKEKFNELMIVFGKLKEKQHDGQHGWKPFFENIFRHLVF